MSMISTTVKIAGISPLLQNNPQTVDRFNAFSKRMAAINAKKTRRTDDDYLELRDIEMQSKVYFDDGMGIYIPSSWLAEAIATTSFRVCKVSKDGIRGSMFIGTDKIKLNYRDSDKVKTVADIVKNPAFRQMLTLPQGQVRVVKAFPIFHNWSFEAEIEYDDKIIDKSGIESTVHHACKYGGFGDFRPKFGRAKAEFADA